MEIGLHIRKQLDLIMTKESGKKSCLLVELSYNSDINHKSYDNGKTIEKW